MRQSPKGRKIRSKQAIRIPQSPKFPKLTTKISQKNLIPQTKDDVLENENIDKTKLAMLINVTHLLANVNWLFAIDIKDIIRDADPILQQMIERPLRGIKNHAADMLKIIERQLSEEYSEGFEELSLKLKNLIYDYIKGDRQAT